MPIFQGSFATPAIVNASKSYSVSFGNGYSKDKSDNSPPLRREFGATLHCLRLRPFADRAFNAGLVACNSETGSISQGREIITAPIYWAWKRFMIVEVDTNLTGTGH